MSGEMMGGSPPAYLEEWIFEAGQEISSGTPGTPIYEAGQEISSGTPQVHIHIYTDTYEIPSGTPQVYIHI